MTDFVEYIPKRHGQKPDYWTPDTLTGLDGKNYVRQPNWAWIAGTTYYVPYEAVHGVPRPAPVDADADADADAGTLDDYRRGIIEGKRMTLEALREPSDMLFAAVASAISRNIRLEWRGHDDAIIPQHSVFDAADAAFKAILDAFEKERSDD